MQIEEHIPLGSLTTFRIGGEARYFIRAQNAQDVHEAISFAQEKDLSVFVLGGGSNSVVNDAGFLGVVIKMEIVGVEEQDDAWVAGAGEPWDALVARAIERGRWGIENLSGIPGTVGGAVVQNIGAYGAVLSETFAWADVYDVASHEQKRISAREYQSGYRDSIFKHEPGRHVVLQAAFRLSAQGEPNLAYKDLAARFAGQTPSLAQIRAAVLEIRAGKFPDLSQEGSAGSFFKNPVLPQDQARALQERYPDMPLFSLPESAGMKVPLGWILDWRHNIIDMRDVIVGGARMYERQFLVMVAYKGASSRDIRELARIVQEKVQTTCGIHIEPEVCFVE